MKWNFKIKSINKIYLAYLVIIMLQILNMIYWANIKTNYYIDELYSMGYASSYTGMGDTAQYITTSETWKFNEWITNAEFKKYLLISDQEGIFKLSFTQAIAKLADSCNYFGLLNLMESITGYNSVTKWPGIFLNIIFFVATDIVLIVLLQKLKMSKWGTGLSLTMFGFCGYFIGLVVYIRFYMLVILMVLIMILLHYIIWTSDKLWQVVVSEIGGAAMAYLGLKNSELMLVYAGALMGCFCIALIVTKKWKKFGTYVLMLFIAALYVACKTKWLYILFHLENYLGAGEQLGGYLGNVNDASLQQILDYLKWVRHLLVNYYYGHRSIFVLWGIFACVLILNAFRLKRNNALYLNLKGEDGFIIILMGTFVIYTLFAALGDLSTSRYYSFGVITYIIIFWYVMERLAREVQLERSIVVYGMITILVVIGGLAPFKIRNIEYIYEQDRELINNLQVYQGKNTILASATEGTISRHEVYDCINLLDDGTQIYAIDMTEYIYDSAIFPNEFILWTHVGRDLTEMVVNLKSDGYEVKYLGADHISAVYICKRYDVSQ